MKHMVGYSDFVRLCRVDNTETWCAWLSVRGDGVYIKEPAIGLLHGERAILAEHPTGNLSEPALRFPCSLEELQRALENFGAYGCIDAFDMADWIAESGYCPDEPTTVSDTHRSKSDSKPDTPSLPIEPPAVDGVSVTLPHMTKALDALFVIMRDNWMDFDPKRLPKQVNIAREIDVAMGWGKRGDPQSEPSRDAKTLAKVIKPDTIGTAEVDTE